jgi:hypothetical protein
MFLDTHTIPPAFWLWAKSVEGNVGKIGAVFGVSASTCLVY